MSTSLSELRRVGPVRGVPILIAVETDDPIAGIERTEGVEKRKCGDHNIPEEERTDQNREASLELDPKCISRACLGDVSMQAIEVRLPCLLRKRRSSIVV